MPKRTMQGQVVSDKNDKTITVLVERRVRDPLYKKVVRRSKKFMAHDESNLVKVGQVVRIRECRPLSKRKCWEVLEQENAQENAQENNQENSKGREQ